MAGVCCWWTGLRMIWNPQWSMAQLPINHDSRSDRPIVLVVSRRDWRRRRKFDIDLMSRRILSRLRSVGEGKLSSSLICSSSLLIMLEEKKSDDFFLLQCCSVGASLIQVGWGCCKDFLCRAFVDRGAGVDGPKADDEPAADSKTTTMLVYELWRAIMLESYEIVGEPNRANNDDVRTLCGEMRTKNFLQARWLEWSCVAVAAMRVFFRMHEMKEAYKRTKSSHITTDNEWLNEQGAAQLQLCTMDQNGGLGS